jgi:hypothetical protein
MKFHTYKYLLVSLLGLVLAFTFCSKKPAAAQEKPQFNMLLIREAYVKDGKMMEAVQFAKELTEYENNVLPNRKARIYFEVFGDVGKIYLVVENKDLATMQSNQTKLMADREWRAILQKAQGLFIEGRTHDTLMAAIP